MTRVRWGGLDQLGVGADGSLGVGVGGSKGPYTQVSGMSRRRAWSLTHAQSERLDMYRHYAHELVEVGLLLRVSSNISARKGVRVLLHSR